MNVLITETPNDNAYIASLIRAYQEKGCTVTCGAGNFYFSNYAPEVLHIQWPESLFLWQKFGFGDEIISLLNERLLWFKNQGARLVYTVHNLIPHDNKDQRSKDIYQLIISQSDIIVHHGERSINLLNELYSIFPQTRQIVCPHGDYLLDYKEISQQDARRSLSISLDSFVILSLGTIRSYKNLKLLKTIFKNLTAKNKYLLVAGRVAESRLGRLLRVKLKWANRYFRNQKWILHRLLRKELQTVMAAADIVLLTHKSGLTSGIIPLAATFNKPVVYPDIGVFEEQAKGWLSGSYKVGELGGALSSTMALYQQLQRMEHFPSNEEWLKLNSWANHVGSIEDALDSSR